MFLGTLVPEFERIPLRVFAFLVFFLETPLSVTARLEGTRPPQRGCPLGTPVVPCRVGGQVRFMNGADCGNLQVHRGVYPSETTRSSMNPLFSRHAL